VDKERFFLQPRSGRSVAIEDAATAIIVAGQVMGSVNVLVDITERLRQDQQTSEALGHTRAELQALSGHLLNAPEEERRQVPRELHDDLAQRTAVAEMQLDHLARFIVPGEGEKALNVLGPGWPSFRLNCGRSRIVCTRPHWPISAWPVL
jgi:signal transduction histidine kinase